MATVYLQREIDAAARWIASQARAEAASLPARIPDSDFTTLEFGVIKWARGWTPDEGTYGKPRHIINGLVLKEWVAAVISEDMGRAVENIDFVWLEPGRVVGRLKRGDRLVTIYREQREANR